MDTTQGSCQVCGGYKNSLSQMYSGGGAWGCSNLDCPEVHPAFVAITVRKLQEELKQLEERINTLARNP